MHDVGPVNDQVPKRIPLSLDLDRFLVNLVCIEYQKVLSSWQNRVISICERVWRHGSAPGQGHGGGKADVEYGWRALLGKKRTKWRGSVVAKIEVVNEKGYSNNEGKEKEGVEKQRKITEAQQSRAIKQG